MKRFNRFKEFSIKGLLILACVFCLAFFTIIIISMIGILPEPMGLLGLGCLIPVGVILFLVFKIGDRTEFNSKKFKILSYNSYLEEELKEQFFKIYNNIKSSPFNSSFFYSIQRMQNEIFIIAHMEVDKTFNEKIFIDFMNEIPEIYEPSICHTLIVVFTEKESSRYLKEIMNCAQYNSLWDTKVYCIYDKRNKKLLVNKTNSGTGNKFYYDVKRELNKIFKIVN